MNDRLHKIIYGQTLDEMKEDRGAWEYEQEPSGETVSLEAFKQVMWERDIAIEQLHELGYELGQKIEPKSPCDLCRYNPPSSADGKPCTMCPAEGSE